jgi:hypothetical protein
MSRRLLIWIGSAAGVLAILDAGVSNTTTGWKRILVKPFDPQFAHKEAGTFLPTEI